MEYQELSREALLLELATLGEKEQEQKKANVEDKLLWLNFQLHQVEIKLQNRLLREAQSALEESRNRYSDPYDFAPIADSSRCPIKKEFSGLRTEFVDITACKQAEAKAMLCSEQQPSQLFEGSLDGTFIGVSEWRLRRKDGAYVPVELSSSALPDGHLLGFVCDIPKQRIAEDSMRLWESKFSGIVALSAEAILSIAEAQRIIRFDEGAEKISGYSKAEAIGSQLDILISERHRAIHEHHVEQGARALHHTNAPPVRFFRTGPEARLGIAEHRAQRRSTFAGERNS